MQGLIKTFVPDKRYGFIRGDDGKDYYFHADSFRDSGQKTGICDDAFVEFEPTATPKGYRAQKCLLLNPADVATYAVPDEFLTSRSAAIRGWEVIEWGEWIVHGSSSDSPDEARRKLVGRARSLGANSLIGVEYYKTTDWEPGTGQGIHRFTVHNFRARIMTVARRSATGDYRQEDLFGLNVRAADEKRRFAGLIRRRNVAWTVILVLSLLVLYACRDTEGLGFAILMVGVVVLYRAAGDIAKDYGHWLDRATCI
jgi:cold shock CspA family protein